jgi:4-carboxymuconolactone decarboxylase
MSNETQQGVDVGDIADPDAAAHRADLARRQENGRREWREVMGMEPPPADSPYFGDGILSFVFGEMWGRPGLSRTARRWITLACVGAADGVAPIESHIRAALASGDITFAEYQEFVLHFAVYLGWPKASIMETTGRAVWAELQAGREAAAATATSAAPGTEATVNGASRPADAGQA